MNFSKKKNIFIKRVFFFVMLFYLCFTPISISSSVNRSNLSSDKLCLSISSNKVLAAKEETKSESKIDKFDVTGTDTKKSQQVITKYISMFGGVTVAFGLTLIGFRMILCSGKSQMREDIMQSFGKVIAGSIIIGSSLILAGFLVGITNDMGSVMDSSISDITFNKQAAEIKENDGTFIIRGLAEVISCVPEAVFSWFGTLAGFVPLDKLIFNEGTPFGIGGAISISPFTDAEWHNLNYIYLAICSICSPLILIMVAKTGFSLIFSTASPAKRSQLQEDLLRWFFCAVLLATSPLLIKGLFLFCNYMTESLSSVFKKTIPKNSFAFDSSLIAKIKTGSILTSAIVKFMFAWKYVEINLIFLTRKVILVVMYAFTPIAILLWGINNKVQASQIWFGEMITNASMQFFYAFTFCVMILSLGPSSWESWLYSLIWMFALIKVAEVLRNSLQGLFTRMAGIDESQLSGKAMGALGGMVSGAAMALGGSLSSGGSVKGDIGSILNTMNSRGNAFGNSLTGGKGGFNKAGGFGGFGGSSTSGGNSGPSETGGSSETSGGNSESDTIPDTIIDPNNPEYIPSMKQAVDSKGNVNLNNLKDNSNRKFLYDSLLNDNLQKHAGSNGWSRAGKIVSGLTKVATGFNPAFDGFTSGVGNAISGIGNRTATFKAVNDTVSQIQSINGGNMNKQQALQELFGGSSELQTRFKNIQFQNAIANGNSSKANKILSDANPFNDLNQKQKNSIIVQTNPYTSVDGFRW